MRQGLGGMVLVGLLNKGEQNTLAALSGLPVTVSHICVAPGLPRFMSAYKACIQNMQRTVPIKVSVQIFAKSSFFWLDRAAL